jgi:redox-sensitive bicupin YhaK (pirin superfamily)
MSAGTGVVHSEFNASESAISHSLQIWIRPDRMGLRPGYEQVQVPSGADGGLKLIAAAERPDGGVAIHTDLRLYSAALDAGQSAALDLAPGRRAWVQMASGEVRMGDAPLAAGDGAAVHGTSGLTIKAEQKSVLLIFDMA